MEHLCSLKNTLMCVSSNIDIAIDIECECGETKYFTFSKKWEAISHGKAFMNNQEVQQFAKGKKQETH